MQNGTDVVVVTRTLMPFIRWKGYFLSFAYIVFYERIYIAFGYATVVSLRNCQLVFFLFGSKFDFWMDRIRSYVRSCDTFFIFCGM